jgi:hypothetical protein
LAQKASLAQKVKQAAAVNADTSSYSNAVTKEMDAHKKDGTGHHLTLHTDKKGETFATYFDSDGCIAIGRPGVPLPYQPNPQSILEWSLGPDKRPVSNPPPLATPINATNTPAESGPTTSTGPSPPEAFQESAAVEVVRRGEAGRAPKLLRVQGGCWDNGAHPWQFHTWWGPANGCWAPLYRQWNDGCTHYQMFNACSGQWDPRITWTFCNPQHHP